jgi:DNA-directed RNA polymerase subunit RPC12/RpoP
MSEKTFTIKCVECGRTAQSDKPLNYWLCPSCKVKLEATPKKIIEHAIKAAEQNKEVRK